MESWFGNLFNVVTKLNWTDVPVKIITEIIVARCLIMILLDIKGERLIAERLRNINCVFTGVNFWETSKLQERLCRIFGISQTLKRFFLLSFI